MAASADLSHMLFRRLTPAGRRRSFTVLLACATGTLVRGHPDVQAAAAPRALLFASYLGGGDSDAVRAMAVGPDGTIHLAGSTSSSDFPTLNALQARLGGSSDG